MTQIEDRTGSLGILLPITVEEITPAWLSDALSVRHPGTVVTNIEVVEIIWGTATKVRVKATYAQQPGPGGPPENLCVKGGFDERVREATGGFGDAGMRAEGDFFRDLDGRLDVTLPRAWFADSNQWQGVVIFDDLVGGEFGMPVKAWTPAQIADGIEELARLHASTWQKDFADIPWIVDGAQPVRTAVYHLFGAAHWDALFASANAPDLPESLRDRARNVRAYEALWALDDAAPKCLVHGDAHLGNIYRTAQGQTHFIDWATVARCPWAYDVAYFLVGGLSVEDRRAHERELLDRYLTALAKFGGPDLDREQAWSDYQCHVFHGLIWAILPAALHSPESVAAMGQRYVAAITDHDVLTLLNV